MYTILFQCFLIFFYLFFFNSILLKQSTRPFQERERRN